MSIKIMGVGPSRSLRVVWAAEEAGLEYEYQEMKFHGKESDGTHNEDYLDKNSQGKVPTIVDGDFVLTESAAIVNYFAAKAPEKNLIPNADPQHRARYDEVCYFIMTELEQPLWSSGKHMFALPEEYRVPAMLEKTVAWEFERAQKALIKLMDGREFAAGDQFTMADVLLAHTISWAIAFKFEILPELSEYFDRMKVRDSYVKVRDLVKGF